MKTNGNAPAITTSLEQVYQGLTKREYFAALAMQGILSTVTMGRDEYMNRVIESAVLYADALIAELNEERKDENRN